MTAQAGASSFAGAWSEGYTYDGFGNLTNKNVTGGTAPSLDVTINAATNHLTGYTYDLNGNLTNIPIVRLRSGQSAHLEAEG